MTNTLKDKVAWVTGGGAGIGAALCKTLAEGGAKVLVTGRRLAPVEKVTKEITESGGTALALQVDVSKEEDNEAAVARALEEWGSLDMVAINAAIDAGRGKTVLDCTLDEMLRTADVNYFGSFLGIKHAALGMKSKGIKGHIVVVGSGTSIRATPGTFAYSSSKHGLVGIAKMASVELLPFGIRVNTMALGMVDTEGLRDAMASFGVHALPSYVDPADLVAKDIARLMANDSPLITGQVIGLERGLANTQYLSAVEEHGRRYAPDQD